MSGFLINALATTGALADVFDDRSLLQAMLDVEVALARAQAGAGDIPQSAAEAIAAAARAERYDAAAIASDARTSGTLTIPLVTALTGHVRAADPASAGYVHWGATSQDIADTALMVLLHRALAIMREDHGRLTQSLRSLSDAHAATVMLGRTLLQPAPPVTFGLTAAGWLASIARSWDRVERAGREALAVQLGGAVGTLAALGTHAAAVVAEVAGRLGLADHGAPWHTRRDRLAALVTGLGIYTAALGSMARDVSLLMQDGIGEVAEPGGGSSTLPHKRNPAGSAIVLAAGVRLPGLVSSYLAAMSQEHQRGLGGWHAELPIVAASVQATGSALAAAAAIADGLEVFPAVMRANLDRTRGVVFAERAMMLLAPVLGRDGAQALVKEAVGESRRAGRSLGEVLRERPEVRRALDVEALATLDSPEAYLGDAERIRHTLLAEASQALPAAE